MKRLWLVWIACLLVSCSVKAYHEGGGFRVPGLNLKGGQILAGAIPDGSGEDGVVPGSGSLMTQEVRKWLLRDGLSVISSGKSDQDAVMEEAKTRGASFVLVGRIPKWEDNATNWSRDPDTSSVALEVYRVSDGV